MSEKNSGKTGYLLIAHGALASEMLNALEFITGKQPNFRAVALDHALEVDKARKIVRASIDEIMGENGALILTDLFGGSPTNITLSMLDEMPIEVVAGINLPMLIHAINLDDDLPILDKARSLREFGQKNIFIASEVLSGKNKKG